ncbi:gephyrin-like molybdotransferase Glp [Methylobacterium brachiatum]|uniref:Molybdopterin molybdenumtransferase n=1 Tax=Methylobacterium brachiatum TaxID=269660 RepID=A0AAJ1TS68_9HYPH|nr:gephyrin-like molybdotransferase Glp [Methylobacterium brachiatum]MCB4801900.1 molybdopterin molybdotransferase MoeA [Methylobacterium brachiatum]MDH2309698.1 molybdopterin molybdotransferase MoeA [Methylobacterium brachiatum]MDQ0542237.1 molybdopterin molybdotransferase [Methylobacterium brachiatum]
MGRLSRDCFDAGPAPMRVAEAVALLRARLPILSGIESVSVERADGRVLAEDLIAPIDLPPFDNAAVDGYAVRAGDLAPAGETRLPLGGRVPAGHAPADPGPGFAVRIFTGAPMPPGTDTVAMQEDVRLDGDAVILPAGLAPGSNRRRAGEDVARGSRAIPAGTRLGPRHLALAAALGLPALRLRVPLKVALFSTGDELTPPGHALPPAGIHDANRPMLAALLRRLGADPVDLGILRDAPGPLRQRLAAAAAAHDLILTTGGVSVGEEDHVRAAVEASGGLTFWRLAIKPGRPVALGQVAGTPFAGLPGNPAAAYVTALAVLRPLVLHLSGAHDAAPTLTVRSGFDREKRPGRREYLRVCLRAGADGVPEAVPAPGGALSGLAASDGLVELAEDLSAVRVGDALPYRPHGDWGM